MTDQNEEMTKAAMETFIKKLVTQVLEKQRSETFRTLMDNLNKNNYIDYNILGRMSREEECIMKFLTSYTVEPCEFDEKWLK